MALTTWILTLGLVFHVGVSVHGQCPDGWVHHDSSCYRLRFDTETWIDALNVCKLDGAYLVEIEDERENNFIKGLITDNKGVWLGGSDLSTEGDWKWITSHSALTYTNWRPTEPNNAAHDENCMEMDYRGFWNDRTCHYIQKYVCEKTQTTTGNHAKIKEAKGHESSCTRTSEESAVGGQTDKKNKRNFRGKRSVRTVSWRMIGTYRKGF